MTQKEKVKMNKNEEIILLGTSNTCDHYSYERYLEDCEANGIEPKDEMSYKYCEEWISSCEQWDYYEFFDNLAYGKAYKEFYGIEYNLGLWNGNREGFVLKTFSNIVDAIKYALQSSRDYQDYKVTFEDGMIVVYCYHHDGTNTFKVRQLSKVGVRSLYAAKNDDAFAERIQRPSTFKKIKFNDIF